MEQVAAGEPQAETTRALGTGASGTMTVVLWWDPGQLAAGVWAPSTLLDEALETASGQNWGRGCSVPVPRQDTHDEMLRGTTQLSHSATRGSLCVSWAAEAWQAGG